MSRDRRGEARRGEARLRQRRINGETSKTRKASSVKFVLNFINVPTTERSLQLVIEETGSLFGCEVHVHVHVGPQGPT